MSEKTELQREILLTWYNNPNATNKEIAEVCDCSASYVSEIKNRFNNYDQFEAMMDRQDRDIEQMFGDDIFDTDSPSTGQFKGGSQQSFVEMWQEMPDDATGVIMKGVIVAVFLVVGYQIVLTLV
jgi:hypothetical protein